MGAKASKELGECLIAASQKVTDGERIEHILVKDSQFLVCAASLWKEVSNGLKNGICGPNQENDIGDNDDDHDHDHDHDDGRDTEKNKVIEYARQHRAYTSISSSKQKLCPGIEHYLIEWYKDPSKILGPLRGTDEKTPLFNFLHTVRHNPFIDTVRFRLCVVSLSYLENKIIHGRGISTGNNSQDLVDILIQANLLRPGDIETEFISGLWRISKVHKSNGHDMGGYGLLFCLADVTNDTLENRLPQNGPVREECMKLVKNKGLNEAATKTIATIDGIEITAQKTAEVVLKYLEKHIDECFIILDPRMSITNKRTAPESRHPTGNIPKRRFVPQPSQEFFGSPGNFAQQSNEYRRNEHHLPNTGLQPVNTLNSPHMIEPPTTSSPMHDHNHEAFDQCRGLEVQAAQAARALASLPYYNVEAVTLGEDAYQRGPTASSRNSIYGQMQTEPGAELTVSQGRAVPLLNGYSDSEQSSVQRSCPDSRESLQRDQPHTTLPTFATPLTSRPTSYDVSHQRPSIELGSVESHTHNNTTSRLQGAQPAFVDSQLAPIARNQPSDQSLGSSISEHPRQLHMDVVQKQIPRTAEQDETLPPLEPYLSSLDHPGDGRAASTVNDASRQILDMVGLESAASYSHNDQHSGLENAQPAIFPDSRLTRGWRGNHAQHTFPDPMVPHTESDLRVPSPGVVPVPTALTPESQLSTEQRCHNSNTSESGQDESSVRLSLASDLLYENTGHSKRRRLEFVQERRQQYPQGVAFPPQPDTSQGSMGASLNHQDLPNSTPRFSQQSEVQNYGGGQPVRSDIPAMNSSTTLEPQRNNLLDDGQPSELDQAARLLAYGHGSLRNPETQIPANQADIVPFSTYPQYTSSAQVPIPDGSQPPAPSVDPTSFSTYPQYFYCERLTPTLVDTAIFSAFPQYFADLTNLTNGPEISSLPPTSETSTAYVSGNMDMQVDCP